ncbi:MAG: hypothetical protein K2X91_02740, partial [Thermoleophilia bacterium]|nr:hypothetical protein [Thermoleophilia bacterium]
WERLLGEPRSAVLLVLGSVIILGGGRRLYRAWQARGAVARLEGDDVPVDAIAGAVEHGRAGLFDLFRLLGDAKTEDARLAAGHAISVLWAKDELIAEEEKALVRRGFRVDWRARKRYPRALNAEIPVAVRYGLPFLRAEGAGVKPENLEWSHRIVGARRASLEAFSPWTPGDGLAEFTVVPTDFETNGPHRLVLQARARTTGLTESWELELPHMPFSFEFDPVLTPAALLALPDSGRGDEAARRIRLEPVAGAGGPAFVPLNASLALREPPSLRVEAPLPADLAHAIVIEFEGVEGRYPAGRVVLAGQGAFGASPARTHVVPIAGALSLPEGAIERPGPRRLRAILTPDPDIGWGDPDVRSLGPEPIVTGWVDGEIVRR